MLTSSVVAAVATLWLSAPVLGRVRPAAAGQLRRGNLNARVHPGGSDEIGELAEAFNDMASELERAGAMHGEYLKRNPVTLTWADGEEEILPLDEIEEQGQIEDEDDEDSLWRRRRRRGCECR